MKRLAYIVLFVLGLTACGTTSDIPLDDAYIWPDKETSTPISANEDNTPATEAVEKTELQTPTLEFTNVQDTTITVKIKR